MNKPIVFSSIQPSGILTIGNYIGALHQWVKMQDKYQCIYCIADLHALTNSHNKNKLKQVTLDTLAIYLACGIDPNKSIIFIQSHVPEHTQLKWFLNCHTYFGELNRMTQFKYKLKQKEKKINAGLFSYPVLMAADILLYQTSLVPVGSDQQQHVELSRNIALRFNKIYNKTFELPKACIPKLGSCIMSLTNPSKKMSKSNRNQNSMINLLEDLNSVSKKIEHAVTDSEIPPRIIFDPVKKAGISNLLTILSVLTKENISSLENKFINKNYSFLKKEVIQEISSILNKIQREYYFYRKNESLLKRVIYTGARKARHIAHETISKIYRILGLYTI